mgnify:CR=1 FL=1
MSKQEEKKEFISKYSVLMSVYYKEQPEFLDYSISSMLKQTIFPSEFVIVEDGPLTEELDKVIDKYSKKYPTVFKIVKLEKNVGLGPALKIGVENCSFEYIARMDSDDYSVPERCEKLLSVLNEHPEYGIIGSFEVEFESDKNNPVSVHRVPETSDDIYEFMKRRCAILHPTVLYKKSVVIGCGNYRDVKLYEDYDLFLRVVLEHGIKCYNIQENLYYIRVNDAFFTRRGGVGYMKTAVSFKYNQFRKGYISFKDFFVSAGASAAVALMPNKMRKAFYLKFLRK